MPLQRSLARLARRSISRGYTAIEVLMAMTVMAVGAAGVMSMQKASVQGDVDAREMDVANAIARMWVERLQRDAMQWTMPNGDNPSLNNFSLAALLSTPTYGQWGLPKWEMGKTNPETMSYAFDILGRDLPAANVAAQTIFCVNYRLQWLVAQALPLEPGLIRADVRVLWPRNLNNDPPTGWCNDGNAGATNPDSASPNPPSPLYHSIYLTTTIRQGAQ